MAETTDQAVSSGSLSTEKVTYRGYAKYNEKGEVDVFNAKAESAQKDEKTGVPKNWQTLADKGYTQHNENEFVRYSVKSEAGFHLLVPSEEQRVYVIQAGLNYIQNSKANGYMAELEEDKTTPSHNNETIDLKDAINEPPSKRSLTPQEKLLRTLTAMGLSKAEAIAMFAQVSGELPDAAETEEASTEEEQPA